MDQTVKFIINQKHFTPFTGWLVRYFRQGFAKIALYINITFEPNMHFFSAMFLKHGGIDMATRSESDVIPSL